MYQLNIDCQHFNHVHLVFLWVDFELEVSNKVIQMAITMQYILLQNVMCLWVNILLILILIDIAASFLFQNITMKSFLSSLSNFLSGFKDFR